MNIMRNQLRRTAAVSLCASVLALGLVVGRSSRSFAQTQTQPDPQTKVAALRELSPDSSGTDAANSTAASPARPASAPDPNVTLDVAKELAALKARIDQVEAELKSHIATVPASSSAVTGPTSAAVTELETKTAEPASAMAAAAPAAQEASKSLPQSQRRPRLLLTPTGPG